MKSPITTHVLDTAAGRPAAGVAVALERRAGDRWERLAEGRTDDDGRCGTLLSGRRLETGTYRLSFALGEYFGGSSFYGEVPIVFEVRAPDEHYHVPLLASPYGYSTYRGS